MNASASATVLCIFQLPAISGVRLMLEHLHSGQRLALDQLQRRAAAGREVGRRGRPGRTARSAAAESPPPTTVVPGASRDGLGDRARAGRERLELERAHRPVPEHGAGAGDLCGVALRRPRADVEAHPAVGHVDAVELARLGVGARTRRPSDEVDAAGAACRRRSASARRAGSTPSSSHSESPTSWPWAREEREAHRAADQDRVGALEERVDDADLVGHLRAADDRDERALPGRRGSACSVSTSRCSRRPARGSAAAARRPRSRRARGARRRTRR